MKLAKNLRSSNVQYCWRWDCRQPREDTDPLSTAVLISINCIMELLFSQTGRRIAGDRCLTKKMNGVGMDASGAQIRRTKMYRALSCLDDKTWLYGSLVRVGNAAYILPTDRLSYNDAIRDGMEVRSNTVTQCDVEKLKYNAAIDENSMAELSGVVKAQAAEIARRKELLLNLQRLALDTGWFSVADEIEQALKGE